ncbi:MAG: hypothetical protein RJA99_1627 [Pseudomonadota bacterium]|jgi:AraC-like DNA-binding protein
MIRHTLASSRSDEFESAVAPLLGAHRIRRSGPARGPFDLAHADFGGLSVTRLGYGRGLEVDVVASRPHWTVSRLLAGRVDLLRDRSAQAVAGGDWVAYAPDRDDGLRFDASAQVVTVALETAALDRAWRTWWGRPAPREMLRHGRIEDPSLSAALGGIVDALWRNAPHAQRLPPGFGTLLRESALGELVAALGSRAGVAKEAPAPSPSVARARDWLHAHLQEDVSLADLAGHAGVSVRALTLAFRREVGASPIRYHRQSRLDAARLDLLAGRGSVTEVAARWGFWNPGDFARHYRERYGEPPSRTRRRLL